MGLIISIIATGVLLYGRINVENVAKSVEILADYEEFALMAKQLNMTDEALFKALNTVGFTGVALKEESLASMVAESKPLEYKLLFNVKSNLDWQTSYGEQAINYLKDPLRSDYDMVIRTYDQETFDFLKSGITARYDDAFYVFFDEDIKTIVLKGDITDVYFTEDSRYKDYLAKGVKLPRVMVSSALEDIGLGYDPNKVKAIQNAGLPVNLRPSTYDKYNSKIVSAYFEEIERYGEVPNAIIVSGKDAFSFTSETNSYKQELYEILFESKMPVGMIESAVQRGYIEQRGSTQMARDLEYNVVRVFPVIEYIQERYNYLGYYEGAKEIENTMYRAITERNIRIIYFRPFKNSKLTYFEDLDEYVKTFEGLSTRLADHGITLGAPKAMPYHGSSPYLLILSTLGLLILGLIILKLVFDVAERFEWVLFIIGTIGIIGLNFVAPNKSIDIFAFVASNIFPTLAILFLIEFVKDILSSNKVYTLKGVLVKTIIGLTLSIVITLIGGFYVGAIMSRSDYLIEMSYFRGVKLSLMLPMAAFVLIYLIKLGYKRDVHELDESTFFVEDVRRFFTEDIKMYFGLLALVFGGIIYIYLARSGHETNIEVLNIELIFRNFLEDHLLARPRTKEIFIAFPALSASIYLACRGYRSVLFPFLLASVLGLTSVVNTFAHARAPIYLSTTRTILSWIFSIIISVVLVLVLDLLNRFYIRRFGSKNI